MTVITIAHCAVAASCVAKKMSLDVPMLAAATGGAGTAAADAPTSVLDRLSQVETDIIAARNAVRCAGQPIRGQCP